MAAIRRSGSGRRRQSTQREPTRWSPRALILAGAGMARDRLVLALRRLQYIDRVHRARVVRGDVFLEHVVDTQPCRTIATYPGSRSPEVVASSKNPRTRRGAVLAGNKCSFRPSPWRVVASVYTKHQSRGSEYAICFIRPSIAAAAAVGLPGRQGQT